MGEKTTELRPIRKSDHLFLYEMLKERKPEENISHKEIPSMKQHILFVSSKPYSKWYIIQHKKEKVGTIYLSKQNEIGFHLKKEFQKIEIEEKILKILFQKHPRKKYFVNVNPKNRKRIQFLNKNDFKLIQYTYELTMDKK
jgi:hypothetical protein